MVQKRKGVPSDLRSVVVFLHVCVRGSTSRIIPYPYSCLNYKLRTKHAVADGEQVIQQPPVLIERAATMWQYLVMMAIGWGLAGNVGVEKGGVHVGPMLEDRVRAKGRGES